ncbi:MAG TPA: alanine racemase, partial [Anaerolineaceae bacterium]|nr:alanine racemase [Anaerolineaceae bacterium]
MNLTPESIQENYQRVLDRVAIAQSQAHYPHPVEIIVVSKGQPSEVIQMAYQVGIRKFGENYPDETLRKIPDLSSLFNLEWHMIGHLQSRKVPIVSQYFHAMHSIDRVEIARKISNRMMENGKTMMALLEMNVSG